MKTDPLGESLKANLIDSTEPSKPGTHTRPEPANAARCILHLFSGPHHRPDGLAAKLKSLGWDCKEYDLVNREQEDLTNDFIWQQVKADIRAKKYDGLIAGPPCNTFTNARKDDGLRTKSELEL